MSDIVEKIRAFVESECLKPTSHYGYEVFVNHFTSTVSYARKLAEKLNGDVEIVELVGWLHDIGAIVYGRKDHHLTGAEIASKKLGEFGYPEEKIELVKKCIINHRGSVNNAKQSVEEQIIADADAMDAFDHIDGLFMAAFVFEKLDQLAAKESVKNKLRNSWNKLSFEESRELVKPKFDAAMELLK